MFKGFCIPLRECSGDRLIARMMEVEKEYQFFEVWLDYVKHDELGNALEQLSRLSERYPFRFLFLTRRDMLCEPLIPLDQRYQLLERLSSLPVFIDLDIGSQEQELQFFSRSKSQAELITSFHHYDTTPVDMELREILSKMEAFTPAIVKLSTYCQTIGDAVRLVQLSIELTEQKKRHVILGMGDCGKLTRIALPLCGGEMIFAPLRHEDASAPGQLTLDQLTQIYTIVGVTGDKGAYER